MGMQIHINNYNNNNNTNYKRCPQSREYICSFIKCHEISFSYISISYYIMLFIILNQK